MSKIESFHFSKTRTEVGETVTTTVQKSFELVVRLPEQFTEEGLQQAIARAEGIIDEVLCRSERSQIPHLDLAEINDLPWRVFQKAARSGSVKKGFLATDTGNVGEAPNAEDLPGWCFREETIPDGSSRTKPVSVELAEAIEKAGSKLKIGEWTFTLKGNLINRSKRGEVK